MKEVQTIRSLQTAEGGRPSRKLDISDIVHTYFFYCAKGMIGELERLLNEKNKASNEYELLKKGVDRETVRAALSEEGDPEHKTEEEAIRTLARKRGYEPDHATLEEKARFYRYLSGKGFGYESIRSVLESEH